MPLVVSWLEVSRVSDDELPRYRGLLPGDELAAAERMADGRLHLCARAFVRECLSRFDPRTPPGAWVFSRNHAGKPFVDGPAFNLSHTEGLVACAVADQDVGIDVEPLARGREIRETVLRAFAPAEVAALRALPGDVQERRAVELWTVKEAYLKGLGTGISRRLDGFAVEPAADGSWRISEPSRWTVRTRIVADRWIVATAAVYASGGL